MLKGDTELFKQFMDSESFRRWLTDTVSGITYQRPAFDGNVRPSSSPIAIRSVFDPWSSVLANLQVI